TVKRRNKVALARLTKELTGVPVDPLSMFDVQVKRIHEYKRQLLNALHIIDRYWRIVEDGEQPLVPRTFLFAGKAAPGYFIATLDGANIEIRDEVGEENIFIFGLRADEVASLTTDGYSPEHYLGQHPWMRRVIDSIASGHFSRGDKDLFRPLLAKVLGTRDE